MTATVLGEALFAADPAPRYAEELALYGWLVGRWAIDVQAFDPAGKSYHSRGEIYAGWVLDGRAVQDVWMIPPRAERRADLSPADFPVTGPWYGTTLRVYDPQLDAWHIHWIDPTTGFQARMLGRASGDDIVQEGTLENGTRLRWSFKQRRTDSFRWTGEVQPAGASDWKLQVDITARRT